MYYTEYNKIYYNYNSCQNINSTTQQGECQTETIEDQNFILGNTGMFYIYINYTNR